MVRKQPESARKPSMQSMSPLQAILAPPKSQNAFKMGFFTTKNGSKMGQKVFFQK